MKKHTFEIIWIVTILLVISQIIYFTNREDLPEGLIILEGAGKSGEDKPTVHLARALNHKYLPSTAKSLSVRNKDQSIVIESQKDAELDKEEVEEVEDPNQPNQFEFSTLPATRFRLKLSETGDFEQINSALETDEQVIKSLAIEEAKMKKSITSAIKTEVTETRIQPHN